ncbi:helix-turn-helix transcriptional regulator [Sphingomonas koreensis]|uniref:helix-turn-helix transcriptional regulator n=1 Tax=Sphingomonas koreensis TaxID=93064 RepID=UPI0008296566|nr:LuxR family transcriptional regulator [Sphingomonas koreensis]PJI87211.1 LuxR family quorum-sensing system transcriptional regulator CciR [Sphingomonas koreensis]
MRAEIEWFLNAIALVGDFTMLATLLGEMTERLGFTYFALTHHTDILDAPDAMIRLHNYPEAWVDHFDRHRLGLSDPVHRASHRTNAGFPWNRVSDLIEMTPGDHRHIDMARAHGLVDGFTVPSNIVGEATGSCSFAIGRDRTLPVDTLQWAQLVGIASFEGARRIWLAGNRPPGPRPRLTDRQRDCLIWAARGKTAWEISRILGISEETVVRHLKHARDRYGVEKQTSLLIRALFDGIICFGDIFRR